MSILACPSTACPSHGLSAHYHTDYLDFNFERPSTSSRVKTWMWKRSERSESLSTIPATQTTCGTGSCSDSCRTRWMARLFAAKGRSVLMGHRDRGAEGYRGRQKQTILDIQKVEGDCRSDNDEQSRKASSSTTNTSSTATTLINTDSTTNLLESPKTTASPQPRRHKHTFLLNKLPSLPSPFRYPRHHENIPETEDERLARKAAKEERRRERWLRWGLVEEEVDHEGEMCGWGCVVHRWENERGYMDWWVVAGMYM